MDLSFRLPRPDAASDLSDAEMAQLVAMLAERQAASVTAQVQEAIDDVAPDERNAAGAPLTPPDGAFNGAMAARLVEWKQA